jgi:DNA (cytosine-5)-methyltransferase 1
MRPRIGSLFTGYGGLDMAAEAVTGGETVWVADIEPAVCRLLEHRYPDAPNLGDVSAVDWATVQPVDVLTGGFPCQDLSHAGKRAGMQRGVNRSGQWGAMCRAIDVLRPQLVLIENVRGLLSAEADSDMEPCPWCVGDGLDEPPLRALGAVLADLADIGYDAEWCGLRASDVGAPHGRFRVFITAHPATDAERGRRDGWPRQQRPGRRAQPEDRSGTTPDTARAERGESQSGGMGTGITRNEQLKMLGNGVVPQQAAAALAYLINEQAAAA